MFIEKNCLFEKSRVDAVLGMFGGSGGDEKQARASIL